MQKSATGKFHFEPPSPFITSFDHLVGAGEQRERESDAERLGSLEINDQLHLRDFQPCVLTQRQLQLLEPR